MNKKYNSLGEKIIFYRKRMELSQIRLEESAGLSTGNLSRIEKGKVVPTLETLFKLAEVLNLNPIETAYLMEINFYKST